MAAGRDPGGHSFGGQTSDLGDVSQILLKMNWNDPDKTISTVPDMGCDASQTFWFLALDLGFPGGL